MGNARILVVEDESIVALDIQNRLKTFGYEVIDVIPSGEQAVELAEESRPDLVLMDINLQGGMDGIEAAEQIREAHDIPVVYLTAYGDENTLARAKVSHPYGYILKPFNERELRGTIEVALQLHGMQQQVKESEDRYRILLESITQPILALREDMTILHCNQAYADFVGSSISELVGHNLLKLFPQFSQTKSYQAYLRALDSGESQEVEGELGGRALRSRVYRTPWGILALMEDFTERKQAEQALRESQARLENVVSNSPLVLTAIDKEGVFTLAEGKGLEPLGFTGGEVVGQSVYDVYKDVPTILEHIRRVLAGETFSATVRVAAQVFEAWYSPIRDDQGGVIGAVGVATNVTDRVKAEGEREHHQRLLLSLSQAAQAVQRARSPEEVYQTVGKQVKKLGFNCGILIPTEDGEHIEFAYMSESRLIQAAQKLLGLMTPDGMIPREPGGFFDRVIDGGEPLFFQDFSDVISQATLKEVGSLAQTVLSAANIHQGILAPLKTVDQVLGLFEVYGSGLTEADAPAVATFAGQIAIAVENARLLEATQRSERDYRQLFENAHDAIVIFTPEEEIVLDINQRACELYGYSREEFIGMSMESVTKDIARGKAHIAKTLERGTFYNFETTQYKRDGTEMILEINASTVDFRGQRAILSINRDVTERVRSEIALRESEERYRSLAEAARDFIYIIDRQDRIAYMNNYAMQLFGARAQDVVGRPRSEVFTDQETDEQGSNLQNVFEAGEPFRSERKIALAGREVWLDTQLVPLKNEAGEVEAVMGVSRDISERMEAEGRLRLQGAALDAAANSILIANLEGDIEWVNPAFTDMTGYSAAEAIGKNLRMLASDQMGPEVYTALQHNIRSGNVWRGELVNRRKDGSLFTVEQTITPVPGQDGEIIYFITIQQDITDRKQAENERQQALEVARRRLKRLDALRNIDTAITAGVDLRLSLDALVRQATAHLQVDAACVLLYNQEANVLEYAAGYGFRFGDFRSTRLRLGEGLAGRAALERQTLLVADLNSEAEAIANKTAFAQEEFFAYCAVPLVTKAQVVGVLEIFNRTPLDTDSEWLEFLETLALDAAIAINNATLFDDLKRSNVELALAYDTTLEGWARALDLRDEETEGHTRRVTELTERLANELGISGEELVHIRRGALLHDIGKMGIPDSILLKPGSLTEDEQEIMRRHPVYAYEMLSPIEYLRPALDIPYCHHEKWDGTGYPRGLKGERIPLSARIFAVVDVWDALLSDRPYRAAWSREKTEKYILEQSGKHFDPRVVDAFLRFIAHEKEV